MLLRFAYLVSTLHKSFQDGLLTKSAHGTTYVSLSLPTLTVSIVLKGNRFPDKSDESELF